MGIDVVSAAPGFWLPDGRIFVWSPLRIEGEWCWAVLRVDVFCPAQKWT